MGRLSESMKFVYKPFGLIAGLIGAKLGHSAFKAIWSKLDDAEPPKATTEEASMAKVVGAKALEAATVAGVGAAVDRAGAASFRYLTGVWPGEKEQGED
jgi:predicted DNA-binding transcriptional regulator YafY